MDLRYTWKDAIQDALGFAGVGAVAYGLYAIYPPATWIFLGAMGLLLSGWLKALGRARDSE